MSRTAPGAGAAGVQRYAVELGAGAAAGHRHQAERGGVRPGGQHLAAVGERDERREAGVAVHELAGAVDRVDDPDRGVAAQRIEDGRVGVHRLLADHPGAGQQGRERGGEVFLGEPVGDGDEVVRAVLLHDVVGGELPEARHDLVGRGHADGGLDGGRVDGEEVVRGQGPGGGRIGEVREVS